MQKYYLEMTHKITDGKIIIPLTNDGEIFLDKFLKQKPLDELTIFTLVNEILKNYLVSHSHNLNEYKFHMISDFEMDTII